MFEYYIEREKKQLFEAIDFSNEYTYLETLMENEKIKIPYLNYFYAEAQWWLFEKQLDRINNNKFDFSNSKIRKLFNKIDEISLELARFDVSALKNNIDSAVEVHINMLLRPNTTLKHFVFCGNPVLPYNRLYRRLSYFTAHSYIIKKIVDWAEDNSLEPDSVKLIPLLEFQKVVRNITGEIVKNATLNDILNMINPIFDIFYLKNSFSKDSFIPVKTLLVLFDDLKVSGLLKIFEDIYKSYDKENIPVREATTIIERFLNGTNDYDIIIQNDFEFTKFIPTQPPYSLISNDYAI